MSHPLVGQKTGAIPKTVIKIEYKKQIIDSGTKIIHGREYAYCTTVFTNGKGKVMKYMTTFCPMDELNPMHTYEGVHC